MATNVNQNPTLPPEIIYETLLYLPVKSLLRCMSVCKSWLSIIYSDDFVKTHLLKSTNDPHFTHHHIFIGTRTEYSSPIFKICSLHSLLNEPRTEPLEVPCPCKKKFWTSVVGYCNGLVCFYSHDERLYLWNPSTRKLRKLPVLMATVTSYCFCYDDSDNDYKVIVTCEFGRYGTWLIFCYSSKSNCWRRIGNFPFFDIHEVVYASRGFYLVIDLIRHNGNLNRYIIVSLDIKTGTYREIKQPKYAEGTYRGTFKLFGKRLSVCYDVKETRVDFWVMNTCGAEECWMKFFTVPCGNGLPITDCFIKPLCICANGDIMLYSNSQILVYNSKNSTFKVLFDKGLEYNEVCTYVESLVSP